MFFVKYNVIIDDSAGSFLIANQIPRQVIARKKQSHFSKKIFASTHKIALNIVVSSS